MISLDSTFEQKFWIIDTVTFTKLFNPFWPITLEHHVYLSLVIEIWILEHLVQAK